MKTLNEHKIILEELKTKEIDSKQFTNNGPRKDSEFFIKGKLDGEFTDDIVDSKQVHIPAKSLKPSQKDIYLGKALGLAIGGVIGGDLNTLFSSDNRILDGHHRWAATMFGDPKVKVGGIQADLSINDLIIVLRNAGDALGNERGTDQSPDDINIFDATIEDVEDAIYNGKSMDKKFYNKDKAVQWYENIGKKVIEQRLNTIKKSKPGSTERKDMPKIEPTQVQFIKNMLISGKIDIRKPYLKK